MKMNPNTLANGSIRTALRFVPPSKPGRLSGPLAGRASVPGRCGFLLNDLGLFAVSLYKRPDSEFWWCSYQGPDGNRIRCSTGTTNKGDAKMFLNKLKNAAYQRRFVGDLPVARTFDEVLQAFLQHSKDHKRSYETDLYRIRALESRFAGRDMGHIQVLDIHSYIHFRLASGVKNGTVNRELALLSAAISHCNKFFGWNLSNPVSGRMLKENAGRVRWITRSEADLLLAEASNSSSVYLADFIRLALHTGCRRGELLGLEWARVDFQAALLRLEPEHTKTARRRSVPLNSHAMAALQSRRDWSSAHCPSASHVFLTADCCPVFEPKKAFKGACQRAGIQNFRVHDMRHTCAAWLVTAGVPLIVVRDLLGHASIKTTEIYAHLSPDNVRNGLKMLE
jgi:integrase